MFQLARGIVVPDLTGIHEAFMVRQTDEGRASFTVNVSADRLQAVFERLSSCVSAPGFLVLETGTHSSVEQELRKTSQDPFHVDVHFLDQLSHAQVLDLLAKDGELLVHDGGVRFGFGSHAGMDEVYVGAYKILEIYTDWPEKYLQALAELGFDQEVELRTVWKNFSQAAPGSRNVLSSLPRTIWHLLEDLRGQGLYLAERRAD